MIAIRRLGIVVVSTVAMLAAALAVAEERYLDFLHRLQEQGYGELAVEYLGQLEKTSELPEDVRELWELEMGNSLRVAADEAANPDQAQQRLAEAQKHLDKFLRQNPDQPEAAAALGALGDIASQRGQILIKLARATGDKTKQAEYFKNARSALEEARPRFTESADHYQSRLRELAPAEKDPPKKATSAKGAAPKAVRRPTTRVQREAVAERQETASLWREARLKLALVDYYVSQTYIDPNDPARKAALDQAARGFDAIYQQYRTYEVGLYAHMWHGKTLDETGDPQNLETALDIYDEVLVNEPEPGQPHAASGLEPLFAQVEYFRLLLLLKQRDLATFTNDATEWLRRHQGSRRTPGYQGIALELLKTRIAQAEKASGEDRRKAFGQILRDLADISKIRSEFQQEAILLRRKYQQEIKGVTLEVATFDAGLSVGDSAAAAGQWEEASAAYARAVELGDRDPQRVIGARYRLAHAQYMAGQVAEAADTAEAIARDHLTSPMAPSAAALAVSAALALYTAAEETDRPDALDRLIQIAHYTTEHWPDRPEADEARIRLGQSNLVRGDLNGAIAVFEQVNSKSERYPLALHFAGQTYWHAYLAEKQKPEAARDPQLFQDYRRKAQERLGVSLDLQRRASKEGQPLPRQLMDTHLLLSEMALEAGQPDQAAPLLEPLVDSMKSSKPETFDPATLRTLVAALRAYVELHDQAKASEVVALALGIGGDTPHANSVLVEIAKLMGNQLKLAEAAAIEAARSVDASAGDTAQAGLREMQQVFGRLLDELAARQQHTLPSMVYIGDSFAKLGLNDKARSQYERILQAVEDNPALLPAGTGAGAITRVRAQLVGLLRSQGKFEEAMREVEQLIGANPKALEPLMEKGRILQSWAETDPKRYDEALTHWTQLRTMLARLSRKPAEYYETIYNAAQCLVRQSQPTRDKQKALQAEQLLKSTLVLSPNLSGPDMVAKYNELLKDALELQGRSAMP